MSAHNLDENRMMIQTLTKNPYGWKEVRAAAWTVVWAKSSEKYSETLSSLQQSPNQLLNANGNVDTIVAQTGSPTTATN